MEIFVDLGVALAIGLLIGTERGWQARGAEEGSRIAGIRTFGLIGLSGGLWALLGQELGEAVLGLAFATVAALMLTAYIAVMRVRQDYGITTIVAALVTFGLGALAMLEYKAVAAAGAVVTAFLLSLKPVLHSWLRSLEPKELYAALKLLLISVVLLPVLPNRGYGPWSALNPYEIWWLVVLIAAISFVGYFAMRIAGARRGILLTGLFGGLASSTATTLSFSRMGHQRSALQPILAVGILIAAATMLPRILLEAAVVNHELVAPLVQPMALMLLGNAAAAAWLWRKSRGEHYDTDDALYRNPFELGPALQFGVLLAVIMVLAEALREWLGDTGIYLLAAVSGISDVDAITLSISRLARDDLDTTVATRAIVLAAVVNTAVKGALVIFIAGGTMARWVAPAVAVVIALGGVGMYLA